MRAWRPLIGKVALQQAKNRTIHVDDVLHIQVLVVIALSVPIYVSMCIYCITQYDLFLSTLLVVLDALLVSLMCMLPKSSIISVEIPFTFVYFPAPTESVSKLNMNMHTLLILHVIGLVFGLGCQ